MSDLILREFNGKTIRQREDGYVCLTDMANAHGKKFSHWIGLKSTKSLLQQLEIELNLNTDVLPAGIPAPHTHLISKLSILDVQNGKETYGHSKVAVALAMWCDPAFFSVVLDWTIEIIKKGFIIEGHADLKEVKAEVKQLESDKKLLQQENQKLDNSLVKLGAMADYCDIFNNLRNRVFSYISEEEFEEFIEWLVLEKCLGVNMVTENTSYLSQDSRQFMRDKYRHAINFFTEWFNLKSDEENLRNLEEFLR